MGAGRLVKLGLGRMLPAAILMKGARRDDRRIALTFDDGPHPQHTGRILAILAETRVPATFFLHGGQAEAYPHLVRAIHAAGHQIGNHGYSHMRAARGNTCEYVADVLRAQDAIQNVMGATIDRIFRPPYGHLTAAAFLSLMRNGYRTVFWSADSSDSFITDPRRLAAHMESLDIGPGDIVLLHEDYAHTVAALPSVLRSWERRSFGFSRICDL